MREVHQVLPGVVDHGVPLGRDPVHQVRIVPGPPADQAERGLDVVLPEQVEMLEAVRRNGNRLLKTNAFFSRYPRFCAKTPEQAWKLG